MTINYVDNDDIEHLTNALLIIKKKTKNQGVIECPKCKGKLLYKRVGTNYQHVWGQCETENCLKWMQ